MQTLITFVNNNNTIIGMRRYAEMIFGTEFTVDPTATTGTAAAPTTPTQAPAPAAAANPFALLSMDLAPPVPSKKAVNSSSSSGNTNVIYNKDSDDHRCALQWLHRAYQSDPLHIRLPPHLPGPSTFAPISSK
jgi:hypothetical protein